MIIQACLQNGLGIVLAGGLGAVLYLQKKEKVQVEEVSDQLSSERTAVSELKTKVTKDSALCLKHLQNSLILCTGSWHLVWQHCVTHCLHFTSRCTGTGNSGKAGHWLAELLHNSGEAMSF